MPQARRRSSKRSASAGGSLGKVQKAQEQNKRRAASRNRRWLKLNDGDVEIIRGFPTDEYYKDGFVHRVPMEITGQDKKKRTIYVDVMCLDQDEKGTPCPGCKDEVQRRYKFWWPIIVRDYEDENGKEADTVVIWSGGITIANRLNKMSERHKLHIRDIEVERSGSGKDDTEYSIEWDDEEDVPLTSADKKLMETAPDLSRYIKVREYDDFYKSLDEQGEDDEDTGKGALKRNPFSKKKKTEDDDDDDDKPARRRTRTSSSKRTGRTRRRTV